MLITTYSREHSGSHSSSGRNTPFYGGSSTPQEDDTTLASGSLENSPERLQKVSEQLKRRRSYGRGKLAKPTNARSNLGEGLQKEHSETGRVKMSVYWRYIEASSRTGFALFLLAVAFAQVFSILGNFALRSWSEDNRASGENTGISRYLAVYGVFSLSSVIFSAIASTVLLLLCSLRSSKNLHDSVSLSQQWNSTRS